MNRLMNLVTFSVLLLLGISGLLATFVEPKLVSLGQSCNSSLFCDSSAFLTCSEGICQCESPSNQRFNNDTNICESIVGGQCSINNSTSTTGTGTGTGTGTENGISTINSRNCILNAHCVEIYNGNYFECQCDEGFIENSKGHCVPGINQPCNYGPDECNPLGSVICKDNICQCLDKLQVYDKEMKRCVSPAGTHCKYDDEKLQLGCVKNALCYPFYYWIPPRCICKPGFTQTANRTCKPDAEYNMRENLQNHYEK